jgi:hypothetical protein
MGTQHICSGSPTEYGACYTEKIMDYHKHTGDPTLGQANGCYTKEVITYHKHNLNCYTNQEEDCTHTITMGSNGSVVSTSYYICPECGQVKFNGYKTSLTCDETSLSYPVYAGLCETCGYTGNATITNAGDTETPATLEYKHKKTTKTLTCGKDETTIESKTYELGCGKTVDTVEKTTYLKTCNKVNGAYYNTNGIQVEPTCNAVVISIAPKTQFQTTKTPNFTLIATYLDGHMAEIQPTTASFDSTAKYNNTAIELTYTGDITKAGNRGTLATYIYVTTPQDTTIKTTPTPTVTPSPTINQGTTIESITTIPAPTQTPIEETPSIEITDTSTIDLIGGDTNKQNDNTLISNSDKEDTIDLIGQREDKSQLNVDYSWIAILLIIMIALLTILLVLTLILFAKQPKDDKDEDNEKDDDDLDFDDKD